MASPNPGRPEGSKITNEEDAASSTAVPAAAVAAAAPVAPPPAATAAATAPAFSNGPPSREEKSLAEQQRALELQRNAKAALKTLEGISSILQYTTEQWANEPPSPQEWQEWIQTDLANAHQALQSQLGVLRDAHVALAQKSGLKNFQILSSRFFNVHNKNSKQQAKSSQEHPAVVRMREHSIKHRRHRLDQERKQQRLLGIKPPPPSAPLQVNNNSNNNNNKPEPQQPAEQEHQPTQLSAQPIAEIPPQPQDAVMISPEEARQNQIRQAIEDTHSKHYQQLVESGNDHLALNYHAAGNRDDDQDDDDETVVEDIDQPPEQRKDPARNSRTKTTTPYMPKKQALETLVSQKRWERNQQIDEWIRDKTIPCATRQEMLSLLTNYINTETGDDDDDMTWDETKDDPKEPEGEPSASEKEDAKKGNVTIEELVQMSVRFESQHERAMTREDMTSAVLLLLQERQPEGALVENSEVAAEPASKKRKASAATVPVKKRKIAAAAAEEPEGNNNRPVISEHMLLRYWATLVRINHQSAQARRRNAEQSKETGNPSVAPTNTANTNVTLESPSQKGAPTMQQDVSRQAASLGGNTAVGESGDGSSFIDKMDALQILVPMTQQQRREQINQWIATNRVPVKSRKTILSHLNSYLRGDGMSFSWGGSRPVLMTEGQLKNAVLQFEKDEGREMTKADLKVVLEQTVQWNFENGYRNRKAAPAESEADQEEGGQKKRGAEKNIISEPSLRRYWSMVQKIQQSSSNDGTTSTIPTPKAAGIGVSVAAVAIAAAEETQNIPVGDTDDRRILDAIEMELERVNAEKDASVAIGQPEEEVPPPPFAPIAQPNSNNGNNETLDEAPQRAAASVVNEAEVDNGAHTNDAVAAPEDNNVESQGNEEDNYIDKLEALKMLAPMTAKERRTQIDEWVEKKRIPCNTRKKMLAHLNNYMKGRPMNYEWQTGRSSVLASMEDLKRLSNQFFEANGVAMSQDDLGIALHQYLNQRQAEIEAGRCNVPNAVINANGLGPKTADKSVTPHQKPKTFSRITLRRYFTSLTMVDERVRAAEEARQEQKQASKGTK